MNRPVSVDEFRSLVEVKSVVCILDVGVKTITMLTGISSDTVCWQGGREVDKHIS